MCIFDVRELDAGIILFCIHFLPCLVNVILEKNMKQTARKNEGLRSQYDVRTLLLSNCFQPSLAFS